MRQRQRARVLLSVLTALTIGAEAACNVFVSLGSCDDDGDCPAGNRCDVGGGFCFDPGGGPGGPSADASTDAASPDASAEAGASSCDPNAPFGTPALVHGFETTSVNSARFTPDELTVLISVGTTDCDRGLCSSLYFAKRASRSAPFSVEGPLGPDFNIADVQNYWPTMSADGRLMFFESDRTPDGGAGAYRSRVWTATRASTVGVFGAPTLQGIFGEETAATEGSPYLLPNGSALYFMSDGREGNHGGLDLFVAKLNEFGGATSITNLSTLNTSEREAAPVVSNADDVLYFARELAHRRQIMLSTRATPSDAWSVASPVTELNTEFEDYPSWLSDDLCRLYFGSSRPPSTTPSDVRLWVAERSPP